jgi:hypothetical protein
MDVTLCNNASESNIINKTISDIALVSCVIKGNLSITDPILLLSYNSSLDPNINYMKIPELNRCYFITDITDLTGGRFEIRGKVDVLESFKAGILGLSAIIDKQQGTGAINMYLDDGSYMVENKEFNSVINFPSGFNSTGEYILITAGGGGGII